jgi:hypothetical protein
VAEGFSLESIQAYTNVSLRTHPHPNLPCAIYDHAHKFVKKKVLGKDLVWGQLNTIRDCLAGELVQTWTVRNDYLPDPSSPSKIKFTIRRRLEMPSATSGSSMESQNRNAAR